MHPDASNAQGWLLLPKQAPGDGALKPRGFWDQASCRPQAKLKLPAQSSSSYCRQHLQAHPGERVDCRLQGQPQGEPAAGRWCKQQRTWPQACLGVASTCNLVELFGLGVDFLFRLHSYPSQMWTILCGLPKSRVNEYIQRSLENTKTGKGIWLSPTHSVRVSWEADPALLFPKFDFLGTC